MTSTEPPATRGQPRVELEPVPREREGTLVNLFQLYAHDFSEQVPLQLDESGRFPVPLGDRWWTEEGHHAFFVHVNGKLAGFALVAAGSRVTGARDVRDVAEFFVVRAARRRGVGTLAAHALFARFPGPWEVRVRVSNADAMGFWARVVEGFAGRKVAQVPFTDHGVDWQVFSLASRAL